MKTSTKAKLISTALVAAAIAAPIAYGGSGTYPHLRSGEGFSFKAPSYWNAGPLQIDPNTPTPSRAYLERYLGEYAGAGPKVERIAPPVHINRSLEVPARYLGSGVQTPAPTPINRSLEVPAQYLPPSEPVSVTTGSDGFDWQDAGIGAAFVAGLGILGVGGFLAVRRRHGVAQLDV